MIRSLIGLKDGIELARRRYWGLHEVWNKFRSDVLGFAASEWLGTTPYTCDAKSDDELHFFYLGIRWYVRFLHDTSSGYIEYGAFVETSEIDRLTRVQARLLRFDQNGNVDGEDEGLLVGAQKFHIDFLAISAAKFLTADGYLARVLAPPLVDLSDTKGLE